MSSIEYKFDGNNYELATLNGLLKLTKNERVLHVQLKNAQEELHWLKNSNEIIGSIHDFIKYCEQYKPYRKCEFEEDEWERHTKIYINLYYNSPEGEKIHLRRQIDSVQGEMSSNRAESKMRLYNEFIYGETSKSYNNKLTLSEICDDINTWITQYKTI
ncbi:hypothetical protein [Evansella tamaricis]|uniref:Uncharacterized protein n=1 Tax=Evansella tamaricis TaxID=2069301 RepID=A0ABS6JLF3_9BACI|nr:hypothetical protein [Evansella tamaricis]MBU9713677.1 hypothetical protein [Evansella tamaricis]